MYTLITTHRNIRRVSAGLLFITVSFVFAPLSYARTITLSTPRSFGSANNSAETSTINSVFNRLATPQNNSNGGANSGIGGNGGNASDGGVVRSGNATTRADSVNSINRTVIIIGR